MAPLPWLSPLSWTLVRHWKKCARHEWHEKSKRSRGKTKQWRRKRGRTKKMLLSLRPWISIRGNFPFYLTSKLKALQRSDDLNKEKHCPWGHLAVTYAHNSWDRIWRLHSVRIRKHGEREGFKCRSMVDAFTTWPTVLWECHCKFLGLIAKSCVEITECRIGLSGTSLMSTLHTREAPEGSVFLLYTSCAFCHWDIYILLCVCARANVLNFKLFWDALMVPWWWWNIRLWFTASHGTCW